MKLIDTHVQSNEVLQIVAPVNIFEQDKFQAELDKLETTAPVPTPSLIAPRKRSAKRWKKTRIFTGGSQRFWKKRLAIENYAPAEGLHK